MYCFIILFRVLYVIKEVLVQDIIFHILKYYYIKLQIDNEWYLFNDQSVTKTDIKTVLDNSLGKNCSSNQNSIETAYLLLYKRRNIDISTIRINNIIIAKSKPSKSLISYYEDIQKENNELNRKRRITNESLPYLMIEIYKHLLYLL